MTPNMYRHQIDDEIRKAIKELKVYRKFGRLEEVEHVERRLASWHRLRRNAKEARKG